MIGIDVRTTWHELPELSRHGWLSEYSFASVLKLQPPLWVWWLTRCPWYSLQQVISVSLGGFVVALFLKHKGVVFAFCVLACPLFQLMSVQPSNDWFACVCLCVAVYTRRSLWQSTLWALVACLLKYSAYAVVLLLSVVMPVQGVITLFCVVWYWGYILHFVDMWWPQEQFRYILQSYFLQSPYVYGSPVPPHTTTIVSTCMSFLHYGQHRIIGAVRTAFPACAWYLFPWYLRTSSLLVGVGTIGILLMGYGNIKYLILLLPLLLL